MSLGARGWLRGCGALPVLTLTSVLQGGPGPGGPRLRLHPADPARGSAPGLRGAQAGAARAGFPLQPRCFHPPVAGLLSRPTRPHRRLAEGFATRAHTGEGSQSRCAIKDAESVMGVGLCRGADSLQPPPIWQMSPQCPLLTPASKAAPLGFPNVPRALVSFSLLPSCRTPLFLLGHWGSLGVPGPSWDGAWAEHTLGAHTVPAAVCVGAGYGHPTAWELYLWDTGSQDPPDSGSPSPCLGFLQEANPRKARLSTPAPAQASRASP